MIINNVPLKKYKPRALTPYRVYALCESVVKLYGVPAIKSTSDLPAAVEDVRKVRNKSTMLAIFKPRVQLLKKYNWTENDVCVYLQTMIKAGNNYSFAMDLPMACSFIIYLDEKLISVLTTKKSIPEQYAAWAQEEVQKILKVGSHHGDKQ